jgi:Ricin-type beta-trefoil lectin domain/Putative Ig domain
MLKRIFAAVAAASVTLLGAAAAAQAQPQPAGHLHGVRVVNLHRAYQARLGHAKLGKISGIVYPLGHHRPKAAKAAATCTEPNCNLVYNGGVVQHSPHVYLLLWGPNWSTDPAQEASATYLEKFFTGLGNSQDIWSPVTSQYPDGTGSPTFPESVYKGAFLDGTTPPSGTTQAQLAAEADAFASNQGITDLTDAQIVVATQSGTCPQGFFAPGCAGGTGTYCAYHSASNEPYVNLPYILDAGSGCGEDFINTDGTNDGWSIVAGHEYGEAITDPVPLTGWIDTADAVSGGEVGDKCAWGGSLWGSHDPATDMQLSTGSFAMQSLWSNATSGCAMSTAAPDTLTLTSPGGQSGTVGGTVSVQLSATSSGGFLITYFASGLPTGLTLNSHTGLISGKLTTAGSFSVTVAAEDETGASRSVSFTWTVSGVPGKPITGDHGKCLDNSGAAVTNGNKVDIWTCNNTVAQMWTFSGGALSVQGKCLDDSSQGGTNSKLVIWTCNGHAAQTWTHKSNGEYVLKLNGLCLTDPSGSSVNGTQVQIRTCNAFADQKWSLP